MVFRKVFKNNADDSACKNVVRVSFPYKSVVERKMNGYREFKIPVVVVDIACPFGCDCSVDTKFGYVKHGVVRVDWSCSCCDSKGIYTLDIKELELCSSAMRSSSSMRSALALIATKVFISDQRLSIMAVCMSMKPSVDKKTMSVVLEGC